MSKATQLNLLNLRPNRDQPSPKEDIHWRMWHERTFLRQVQEFMDTYGEPPICWMRLPEWRVDCLFTSPQNMLVIDLTTGLLVTDRKIQSRILLQGPGGSIPQRRRHVSPQVAAVLDGCKDRCAWTPEIMEHFRFYPQRLPALEALLKKMSITYCLDWGMHKNQVRTFASPKQTATFFQQAADHKILDPFVHQSQG